MNWEYILEVPFESKGLFYGKKKAKYKFKGKNYFLLNSSGRVLRDFTILEDEFSYRENDNAMMIGKKGVGTDFWNNPIGDMKVSDYRKKILTSSPINNHVVKGNINIIEKINKMSIEHSRTSLTIDAFLSGSNSSGADTKISAAPLICVDERYYGMRHINPFRKLRVSTRNYKVEVKYPITIETLTAANKLSLSTYFELFPECRKEFYKFNPESKYLLYNDDDDVTQTLYYINYSKKEMATELHSYQDLMGTLFTKYSKNIITRDNLASKLRGLLRPSLLLEKRMIDEPVVVGMDEKEGNMDAAHLMEVNDLKKHKIQDWWMMGDVNNGLLLPKDLHWKFDKDKDFVLNDNFEFVKNGVVTELKINPKYINNSRKQYLKERYNS